MTRRRLEVVKSFHSDVALLGLRADEAGHVVKGALEVGMPPERLRFGRDYEVTARYETAWYRRLNSHEGDLMTEAFGPLKSSLPGDGKVREGSYFGQFYTDVEVPTPLALLKDALTFLYLDFSDLTGSWLIRVVDIKRIKLVDHLAQT